MTLKQFGATVFLGLKVSLEEFLEEIVELGLGYLELKCEPGLFYPREIPPAERAALRRAFREHGLTPTAHASFYDINLASLNPLIREASSHQLLECIQLTHDLGAELLVVHPGELPGDYPEEGFFPLALEGLISGLEEPLRLAEDLGVTLALENKARGRNRGLIQFPEEHLSLIETFGSLNCRAAFDVGHAHTFGLDLLEYLETVLPYLAEVHLHDNDGSGDQHRPLGRGTIDFHPLFRTLVREGYHGPLILEMTSVEDLRYCREYLFQMEYSWHQG